MNTTPKTARAIWPCPLSRLWGDDKVNPRCRGDECPLWRWVPLDAESADFKAAVSAKMKDLGGGPGHHKAAVAYVMENRAELGLPVKPTHGFCGMGGKP